MRTAVDVAAELAEQIARRPEGFDADDFAEAFQRAQPGLVRYQAEQWIEDDPVEYRRIKQRDEALKAVCIELRLLGAPVTAAEIDSRWNEYLSSATARRWRELGGPDADGNELDSLLYVLTLHNGGGALGERRLRKWLEQRRAQEARSSKVRSCP